jgi:EAL domain-containing protein (putative c-di-GMP-specific phosphodiesterase class I)
MEWLGRIRSALQTDRMFLDAQRIDALRPDGGLRYELLVRLRDEDGDTVPPGAFLPAAERLGAAHQIDRGVI